MGFRNPGRSAESAVARFSAKPGNGLGTDGPFPGFVVASHVTRYPFNLGCGGPPLRTFLGAECILSIFFHGCRNCLGAWISMNRNTLILLSKSVHVWTLVLFFGLMIMIDLRLLGWTLRGVPVSDFIRRVLPWAKVGFAIMVITGTLLVFAIPLRFLSEYFLSGQNGHARPGRPERMVFSLASLPKCRRIRRQGRDAEVGQDRWRHFARSLDRQSYFPAG